MSVITPARTSSSRRWILLAVVSAGLLLITIDNSVLYTALPTLTRELGASGTESLWIVNAYPLVMAGLLLGAGTLGDRVGHRRLFLIGLVVFGFASLLAAFSPAPLVLIGARALLAVGAAAMMPATLALIRLGFSDVRERNIAIGIWGSVSVVGAAAGPILGGLLLEWFWWGSVFLINVPIVIAALVATPFVAPHTPGDRSRPWDLASSLLAMVGLAGVVVALKEVTKAGPSWLVVGLALVVGVAGLALFVRRQRRLPYPLLDLALFRRPALSAGVLAAGVALFTIAGAELVTAQRFQGVEGFSPLNAGLVVAALALGSLPSALAAGALLHRVGPRPLIAGGLGLAAVGAAVTPPLMAFGWGGVVAGLAVAGVGLGFVMASASAAIIGSAPAHRAGMASSVEEVSYELGGLVAIAVLGGLITSTYAPSAVGAVGASGASGASGADPAFTTVLLVIAGVLALSAVATARLLRNTPASALSGH
ncbi:MFS transporter [Herbiconiux flava]|uniref:DHA2 family multidrug resistance protein-like MFS transporter n=1 Tax=Herbiconiux flava TaxID=881268 RepID=A0A852SK57_9MICO|nr:MFS transporter [Herbiconiux flava]NYD69155.1 DHA2 family multidrug resistance protein-like MFS transporter [Herbiconiux flava]